MLSIHVKDDELFDDKTETFYPIKGRTIQLEHSLISLRKWESKWHKPFLSSKKTEEESLDYVKCMTITPNVDPLLYYVIPETEMKRITSYIEDPMTATWFSEEESKKTSINREKITAEIIYFWMIESGIPIELEKWHLNQLLTLIRVINVKRTPPKKMTKRETLAQYAKLNAQRRAKFGTRG